MVTTLRFRNGLCPSRMTMRWSFRGLPGGSAEVEIHHAKLGDVANQRLGDG